MKRIKWLALPAILLAATSAAWGAEGVSEEMLRVNNTWMIVATAMVFMMHLGFATLETGLTRAKNTVNILFKNTMIVAIGLLTYAMCGFNLMYPGGDGGHVLAFAGFGLDVAAGAPGNALGYHSGTYTYWTDFIFQAMFAATAATIVSGAVAERVKLGTFLLFSVIYVAVIYPIVGSWGWGNGWLAAREVPFHDFAGSTFVHSVGGWAALAGVLILGPRVGKYFGGASKPIPGHSMPLATIGVFLLWFGWFGFNGGSVLSADPTLVSLVIVTTSLAAAAGLATSMATSWIVQGKPDLTMVLNGALAGLVGITAPADVVTPTAAILIGGIAGVVVVLAVLFIDSKLKIDDPVGATSVHLVCGVWGTIAVGLFSAQKTLGTGETDLGLFYGGGSAQLVTQLIGVGAAAATCFISALVIFKVLDVVMGLRVSEEEELRGLDIGEHGMESYAGFQIFTTQ